MATKNSEPIYNQDLIKAVKHLYRIERIEKDKDIVDAMGYKKNTVSGYITGKVPASEDFRTKFEDVFKLKLAQFIEQDDTPPDLNQILPLGDLKVTLKDYIDLLRQTNADLVNIINSTLSQIHSDQRAVLAHEKAWVEYEAEKEAGGNEQKKQEIMYKMNTLVHGKLGGKTTKGSPAETGK